MNDRPRIFVGLAVGLVALTFPFWYTLATGRSGASPQLELPAGESQCVEDTRYMKVHHMELLQQWQQAVVREGKKTYVSKAFGKSYQMSFTKTCMGCHANRETFCNRCHTQVDVRPSCWDCHFEPEEK